MAGRKKGSVKLKVGDKVTNLTQDREGVIVHIRKHPITLKGWENKKPPFYETHWTTKVGRSDKSYEVYDNLKKVLPKSKELAKEVQE